MRFVRKYLYYKADGQIFKTTVEKQCTSSTTIDDVCYKYEKHVEKVRFFNEDNSGTEKAEPETYYIGTVYKSLHELAIGEPEEYSKITKGMSSQQKSEDDCVYVRTETGRFIALTSEFDIGLDIRDLQKKNGVSL